MSLSKLRKRNYRKKSNKKHEIICYIAKGNKQIAEHVISASRYFIFEGYTYVIKEKCVFLKKEMGKLKQCLVYVEGNPNPYDFKNKNIGLSEKELNDIYGEEFYNILVKCQLMGKMFFVWILIFLGTSLNIVTFLCVLFGVIL